MPPGGDSLGMMYSIKDDNMTRDQAQTRPLRTELQAHRDQLTAITQEVHQLTTDLSAAQWHWSPVPHEWSIAQCLDHLNVTNGLLLPRFQQAIEQAQTQELYSEAAFYPNWLERWFIRSLSPDATIKPSAPRMYVPADHPESPTVLPRFLAIQEQLIQCVETANGLDLQRVKVVSPVTRLLRLSLGTWFAATVAHEWNHVRQAQAVQSQAGFP